MVLLDRIQTVSCTRRDCRWPGSSSYPSITINALVAQTAPSMVTNTALVGGGGEINLTNDIATDVASVVSVADLSMTNAASPNPVAAGSNITYTQVVTNNGPSAADNAALVESDSANTTFVSIAAPAAGRALLLPSAPPATFVHQPEYGGKHALPLSRCRESKYRHGKWHGHHGHCNREFVGHRSQHGEQYCQRLYGCRSHFAGADDGHQCGFARSCDCRATTSPTRRPPRTWAAARQQSIA